MPNNNTKKKYKNKLRSCALCKPHKKNWADNRTVQEIRKDAATSQEISEAIDNYSWLYIYL